MIDGGTALLLGTIITTSGGIIVAIIKSGGKVNDRLTAIEINQAGKVNEKDCENRRASCSGSLKVQQQRHFDKLEEQIEQVRTAHGRLAERQAAVSK
jgi:hypothetical protein